jgi:hypothetical protein
VARTQFTFTLTNAQPGASVTFSYPVYPDGTSTVQDGPTLVLDSSNTVAVWADSDYLIAVTVDGRGLHISGTATKAAPTVTVTDGTAGTSPFGSGGSRYVAKTADYTAVAGDVVLMDATAANRTVTLPAPFLNAAVWVKKTDSGVHTVTVAPHAAETVDGGASLVLSAQYGFAALYSDGTNWWEF